MTGVFTPRLDILPPAQQRLWPELRPAASLGFALYGGTAIALRLGHRMSVDFDFFCNQALDRAALQAAFPFIAQSTVLQDQPNTLTVNVPYSDDAHTHVKVSFFGGIGIGRVGQPSESLKAMVYFEDGDLHTLTQSEKACLVKAASEVRDLPAVAILERQLTAP